MNSASSLDTLFSLSSPDVDFMGIYKKCINVISGRVNVTFTEGFNYTRLVLASHLLWNR